MDTELTNESEEKIIATDKKKSILARIKEDKNNNYGSYAALIGVILTILSLLSRGISTIAIEGYNSYFSISNSYNEISEANILSNLFDLLFKCLILLLFNFFMGYAIIKTKGLWKTVRNVVCIYIVTMVAFFIFACAKLDYNIIKNMERRNSLGDIKMFIFVNKIMYSHLLFWLIHRNCHKK